MEKRYNPEAIEARWCQEWQNSDPIPAQLKGDTPPFSISLPPPNVTGSLHMGHAFQISIIDCLVRYRRMLGQNTLWQPGTDHAGIATQILVEKQLEATGVYRLDIGRDRFIEQVWGWKQQSGNSISKQLRRLGASLEWSRDRFTMDPQYASAVRQAFITLHERGFIYRCKRLVNWDPKLKTAVSDLEVMLTEETGSLWEINYSVADEDTTAALPRTVTVATTRPETMLGDTAVAVHPNDERYQKLIGKHVTLPLVGRRIPIIADSSVDPTFGTGCVKITPAHDFNDYQVGETHNLPIINIFTADARINSEVLCAYTGMDRFEARKRILRDLESCGCMGAAREHRHKVPRSDRSGCVIEPYLTDQWFVRMRKLARHGMKAVKKGKVKFTPKSWQKTYCLWLENIEDWCISRQLWWGHQIPAWHGPGGEIWVGHDEQSVRTRHALSAAVQLRRDPDVLDTWFSSALWPFATLGWPEKTHFTEMFYPNSLLVTGFDIIFFWVARMVMLGIELTGNVPFREVYVHGLVRDSEGRKMSKSKGNVLDPIDVIEGIDADSLVKKRSSNMMQPKMEKNIATQTRKQFPQGIKAYGVDALRFAFLSMASTGRDVHFDIKRIEGCRNFCNKLWNAARFVSLNVPPNDLQHMKNVTPGNSAEASLPDQWIKLRFNWVTAKISEYLERYRFDLVASTLYDFVWHDYCDWYLEWSKIIQQETIHYDEQERLANRRATLRVLIDILRAAHPVIPFITEEIWYKFCERYPLGKSQNLQSLGYPEILKSPWAGSSTVTDDACWLQEFVQAVRQLRSELNISPNLYLNTVVVGGNARHQSLWQQHCHLIVGMTRIDSPRWLDQEDGIPLSVVTFCGSLKLYFPCEGIVHTETEIARLTREVQKNQEKFKQLEKQLANKKFLKYAPESVVATGRQGLQDAEHKLRHRQQQLDHFKKSLRQRV